MSYQNGQVTISDEERRQFLKVLGVTGTAAAAGELTLSELRNEAAAGNTEQLASVGESIRADLAGSLDAGLLAAGTEGVAEGIGRVPELEAMGFLSKEAAPYAEVAAPGWEVYNHLKETSFFASAEEHLPGFTAGHIESTARELVRGETLTATLSSAGFSGAEMTAVVADVANSADRLSMWVPTSEIPAGVEFDVENVAPVHQRAAGGALLWIEDMDQHLWQKKYLLTEELLSQGLRDVKVMLGGLYLLGKAAADIAGPAELSDKELTTALTGGSAAMIVGQEAIANDLFRITDEMRAPRGGETA